MPRLPDCSRCASPLTVDVRYALSLTQRVPGYRAIRGPDETSPERFVLCPPCTRDLRAFITDPNAANSLSPTQEG